MAALASGAAEAGLATSFCEGNVLEYAVYSSMASPNSPGGHCKNFPHGLTASAAVFVDD